MKLTLLTCTHDRHDAILIAAEYIARQTRKPDKWVIVDDGTKPCDPAALEKIAGIKPVYFRRVTKPGQPVVDHTLPLNIHAALHEGLITKDDGWIIFWEDDDWYAASYLDWIQKIAEETKEQMPMLIGQSQARYYRLQAREFSVINNNSHASLCATVMSMLLYPVLDDVCYITHNPFVDLRLWAKVPWMRRVLRPHGLCVGIKQFPSGFQGTTMGWRGGPGFLKDYDGRKLIEWVGEADAARYEKIIAAATPVPIPEAAKA